MNPSNSPLKLTSALSRRLQEHAARQPTDAGRTRSLVANRYALSRSPPSPKWTWAVRGAVASTEELRHVLPPFVGELPRVLGFEPFYSFPSAVFIMTFLAFFIGTFLQLMWEDIPITERL